MVLWCMYKESMKSVIEKQEEKKMQLAICTDVFADYDIEYCYLFGSYAKGKATETSDVDLLIGTSVSGIHFYGLVEAIREGLHKRVDILNREQLESNLELINEILKDGIKIYG